MDQTGCLGRSLILNDRLTKGGPGNTLLSLSLSAYNTGFVYRDFGASLPYILVLWILIYFIAQRLVKNWLNVQKTASGN